MATYRSDSSAYTTLTLNFTETGRSGNEVTVKVDWSVTLGPSTGLEGGNQRILYIHKSDGTYCGEAQIKAADAIWTAGSTYSGTFTVKVNVGQSGAGSVSLYGITNTTSIGSCTWTNRAYCVDIAFEFSAACVITFNNASVHTVIFNEHVLTGLVINGTTIF